jgi:hypothetical protein
MTAALEQDIIEHGLDAAAERNGVVSDDGERKCWATIRSGLSKGLQQRVDLDAGEWAPSPGPRRRRRRNQL